MKHYGDITQLRGDQIEPVSCITGGSPCQDLSIAGKRAGLAGERSGLFMEMIRIIKEMRNATNGKYPKFAIQENVRGALSSNNGEDFRCVLEEFAHIIEADATIPRPAGKNGKWAKSGAISGNGWSLAWRLFDAQYWGVPQRRQRIALVMDFGGQRAAEILFERTGVSGNPDESVPSWEGITGIAENCTARDDRVVGQRGAYTLKIRSGCEGGGKAMEFPSALPQWFWIAQKIKPYLPAGATLGSLFDGIGGFPLIWEAIYGKGTARWASEIEEFCVAVTKKHFPEN